MSAEEEEPIPKWTTNAYLSASLNFQEPVDGSTDPVDFNNIQRYVEEGNDWALSRLTPFADDEHLARGSKFFRAIAKAANAWGRARYFSNNGQYERSKNEAESAELQMTAVIGAIKSLRGGKVRILGSAIKQHRNINLTINQYHTGGAVAGALSGID